MGNTDIMFIGVILAVFSIKLIISILFIFKHERIDVWYKDYNTWIGVFYAASSILFIQLYVRILQGAYISKIEIRLLIIYLALTGLVGIFSRSINHGVLDGILCRKSKIS